MLKIKYIINLLKNKVHIYYIKVNNNYINIIILGK